MNASLFESLGQLLEWMASWIPRLGIMPPTHGGVRFRRGRVVREIKPGVYVYLPILTIIKTIVVVDRPVNLPTQTLQTLDGQAVAAAIVVLVDVIDVERACTRTENVDEMISNVALAATTDLLSRSTLQWISANITGDARVRLTKKCRKDLHPYGVRVKNAFFSDLCPATVLRLIGNDSVVHLPVSEAS